ncbi:MAG: ThiF family adenylyltransferase [Desulfuromonadaceae bacterium]|nr:ThiF family adenylyltransferase [Desulfuromonadaceae bacterium]
MGRNKKKNRSVIRKLTIPPSISQAVRELENFPDVLLVGEPVPSRRGWGVVTMFSVPLPSRATELGISSTGVKESEPVMFLFPISYPRKAPKVRLREDFPRNLPHLYPGSVKDFVVPCIYDGSLDDLLHQGKGLHGILEQVQDWLRKAASNSLINNRQGWEPIRFDSADNFIIYEHAKLRGLETDEAGCKFLSCESFELSTATFFKIYRYLPEVLNGWYARDFGQSDIRDDNFIVGQRPVMFCWPDKNLIVGEYFPETVTNLGELLAKSRTYGTYDVFWQQIQLLWIKLREFSRIVDVITIHCVRRPLSLIGQSTNLELLAYRVRLKYNLIGVADMNSPVEPVCHIHAVGPELLQSMSGSSPAKMESIIQIGCGSLGSKIAMHLCKAGHGPFALIDDKHMSEHNLARHALAKTVGNKAEILKKEIDIFNVGATAHPNSLQDFVGKDDARLFEKESLIIDSTASISVRETLASLPAATNNSRVFQTGLYNEGQMGYLTIEGKARNPRVDDLSAALFDAAIDNGMISKSLVASDATFRRHATGQGCGSFTTVIADTRISMYSAAMAERAKQAYEGGISENGELSLGFVSQTGMSLEWKTSNLGKTHTVPLGNRDWELRVLAPAYDGMAEEVGQWPATETGGILIGRLCLARKCAIITRVIEAPPDSIRTSGRFELGTEGLVGRITAIQKSSGLTYLGTWHSHLHGSTPSGIDAATLKKIKALRLGIPAFNLIWHSGTLTCFADYGDY